MATNRQSYFTPMPSFGGSEWNNRNAWAAMPKTADMRVLDLSYQRSKAAHDALMRAQAMEAEQDNAILSTATPEEYANLFGTPRTEREARLQRIVQKDYKAKELGAQLIPNERQKVAYQQSLANLQGAGLENAAARLNLMQDPIAFAMQQRQGDMQLRAGEANILHANNADMYAANANTRATEDQDFQKKYQEENQAMKRGAYGTDQAKAGFLEMMQMEKMWQDNADQAARQAQAEANWKLRKEVAESNSQNKYFGNLANAANAGALTPEQLSQLETRFDPDTMAMLQGYAKIGAGKNAWFAPKTTTASPSYLSQFANMPFQAVPGVPVPIPNPFSSGVRNLFSPASPTPYPDANLPIQWPDDGGGAEGQPYGNFAPPPAMAPRPMSAQPMAPAPQTNQNVKTVPQNFRGNYVEGQEYPARDRSVWRYTNGQMIRIR